MTYRWRVTFRDLRDDVEVEAEAISGITAADGLLGFWDAHGLVRAIPVSQISSVEREK